MNNLLLLTKVQLSETLFSRRKANGTFRSKSTKAGNDAKQAPRPLKKQLLTGAVLDTVLSLYFSFNMSFMFSGLTAFAILSCMIFLMYAVTGLTDMQSKLFDFRDFDILSAMPLKPHEIIGSKLLSFTFYYLFYGFFFVVPGSILAGILAHASVSYYLLMVLGFAGFLLPAVVIAALLGLLMRTLIGRSRYAHQIELVLNYVFSLAIIVLAVVLPQMLNSESDIQQPVMSMLQSFPTAQWYVTGAMSGNIGLVVLSTASGLAIYAAFMLLFSRIAMHLAGQRQGAAKTSYKGGKLKQKDPLSALVKREFHRLFGLPVYCVNVLTGGLLIDAAAIFLICRAGAFQPYVQNIESKGIDLGGIALLLSLLAATLLTTISPTCCSISLEGRQLWILKTAPVSTRKIFLSKMIPQYVMAGIPALLIVAAYLVYFPSEGLYALLMVLFFAALLFWTSSFGLMCDLKHADLDWESPVSVVKQSGTSLIVIVVPMLVFVGLFLASIFLVRFLPAALVFLLMTALLAGLGVLETRKLKTAGVSYWENLI